MYFLEFEFKVELGKNGASLECSIFMIAVLLLVDVFIPLFQKFFIFTKRMSERIKKIDYFVPEKDISIFFFFPSSET